MGGYYEVYTSLFEGSGFSYANVRKASYTGSVKTMKKIRTILTINLIH